LVLFYLNLQLVLFYLNLQLVLLYPNKYRVLLLKRFPLKERLLFYKEPPSLSMKP
jgi:hypothetical protein